MSNVQTKTDQAADWDDVKVAGMHGVAPQEAFEPILSNHLLVLHLTPQPVRVFEQADGYHGDGIARPGDINLFSAGDMSYCRWEKELTFIRLDLAPSLTDQVAAEMELSLGRAYEFQRQIRLRDDRIVHLAQWLHADQQGGGAGGKLYADSLKRMLSLHLLQHYGTQSAKPTTAPQRLAHRQLAAVLDYIHANLGQDMGLDELAAAAHMSASHFVRLFKEATGLPPHQYVLRERIRSAQRLLLRGNAVQEVAAELGFSDQSHLHRHFKRLLGVTPREFVRRS